MRAQSVQPVAASEEAMRSRVDQMTNVQRPARANTIVSRRTKDGAED